MTNDGLVQRLYACDDSTSVCLPNGARFIRKLPDQPPLAFLHKLYAPLSEEGLIELRKVRGGELPSHYEAFLRFANGATLFANTLSLYGVVDSLSRSIELRDQTAISLHFENEIFAKIEPDRWNDGWMRVGGMVGWDRKWHLELHSTGRCAVLDEAGGSRAFPSFQDCLDRLCICIECCCSCDGLRDQSYQELEAALSSLIRED